MKPAAAQRHTVLHYTGYENDRGGIMAVIRNLVAADQFECVLGVNTEFVASGPLNVALLGLPRIEGEKISPLSFWRAREVAQAVRAWLRAGEGRVFHGHSRAGLLVALWLTWMGERRVVVSVHCYGRQRWFYRWAARRLSGRLYWLTPAMKRHYGFSDADWSHCMPNFLPVSPSQAVHRRPSAGTLRVGGAGALVRWKRWDVVLTALACLPTGTNVEFTHIGGVIDAADSRSCERELHAQTRALGLEKRVRWLGWQPSSATLLSEVDVVVVASDGEPFSMIALEALFAGVPVIATRGGGPEDLIVDGQNGWLIPARDPAALARALEKCLQPEAWGELRFTPEQLDQFSRRVAGQWAAIYAQL